MTIIKTWKNQILMFNKTAKYYSIAKHYHLRNWLSLFYLLLDAAITNSYISLQTRYCFKSDRQTLIRNTSRRDCKNISPRTWSYSLSTTSKDSRRLYRFYHIIRLQRRIPWSFLGKGIILSPPNGLNLRTKDTPRTIHFCTKCEIPICYNSHCWDSHLAGR